MVIILSEKLFILGISWAHKTDFYAAWEAIRVTSFRVCASD